MCSLFNLAETFSAPEETISLSDYGELQSFFLEFQIRPGWAQAACRKMPVEEFRKSFGDLVQTNLFSVQIKTAAFEVAVKEDNMVAEAKAFLNTVPVEYKTNKLPAKFGDLNVGRLSSTATSSGDRQLVQQIQFITAFHGLLKAGAALRDSRGPVAIMGEPGGSPVFSETSVAAAATLRHHLSNAQAVLGAAEQFLEGSPLHVKVLDDFLVQDTFAAFALDVAERELRLWKD